MKTPSDTSTAIFTRYSWNRSRRISEFGKAATFDQPLEKHGSAPRQGPDIEIRVFDGIFAFAHHLDGSGEIDVPLRQHLRYARMLRIGGAIDVLGFELLVDRIFLVNLHDGEDFAGLGVDERDLLFGMDAIGKVFVYGKCDRDRPEDAAGQFHIQARTAPVVMPHKPIERRIGAHCQHEDVGDCA